MRLQEILKQPQYEPVNLADQVMVLYAAINGYADSVPVDKIKDWEEALLRHLNGSAPDVAAVIDKEKAISKETEEKLKKTLVVFSASWA